MTISLQEKQIHATLGVIGRGPSTTPATLLPVCLVANLQTHTVQSPVSLLHRAIQV